MNNSFNFSEFSRQSPKGILVIYLNQIYNAIRVSWIVLFFIFKDFSEFSDTKALYIILGVVAVLVFLLIRAILTFKNFIFKIEDQHLILKQGILKKTNTSIPFHRIQNINFKQNVIQQLIGVYEVAIETAGSNDTEIAIKALSLEKAEAFKDLVSKSTTVSEDEIEKKETPFVKISVAELFKVSLTENHLQNLFLFLAVMLGFFQQIQQIFNGFGKTEELDGFIKESTNALSTSLILILILLIFLVITAFLSSFVRVFLNHFNLTAYLKDDSMEINQGLFTKKSIVLKKQKVQNITVSTNPLKRLIGINFITFKQAVSGVVSQKKDKLIRLVGCKIEQVNIIKENLFAIDTLENETKHYPDSYYKRRVYILSFLFVLICYVALFFFVKYEYLTASLIVVIPITLLLISKKLKKRYYKISNDFLLTGTGLIETHTTYLEKFKVQNIKFKQTIFQERSKVADLVFQTASGKITIPCIPFKDAVTIYNDALYKVETSTKSWM